MYASRAFANEYQRLLREIEAMHEIIRVLMAEVQALKDANKEKRGPGRPPKDNDGNRH